MSLQLIKRGTKPGLRSVQIALKQWAEDEDGIPLLTATCLNTIEIGTEVLGYIASLRSIYKEAKKYLKGEDFGSNFGELSIEVDLDEPRYVGEAEYRRGYWDGFYAATNSLHYLSQKEKSLEKIHSSLETYAFGKLEKWKQEGIEARGNMTLPPGF